MASLLITIIAIQVGNLNRGVKLFKEINVIKAATSKVLSARGSIIKPKTVLCFNLLAIKPSTRSLRAARQKIASATHLK